MNNKDYSIVELNAKNINDYRHNMSCHILMLCTAGSITMEVNMMGMTVNEGCRVCLPNVIMLSATKVSADFKAIAFAVNSDFIVDITAGIPGDILHHAFLYPVQAIENHDDWLLLLHIMNTIRAIENRDCPINNSKAIIGNLYRAMIFVLEQTGPLDSSKDANVTPATHFSATDTYYLNFLNLLNKNIKQNHEVGYYAEKLNITPKYLNNIIKQKTGRKAKEIISQFLTSRLKYELLSSGKSLKGIAYDYNFADQSSLGKFFRKMTGQSPLNYRESSI